MDRPKRPLSLKRPKKDEGPQEGPSPEKSFTDKVHFFEKVTDSEDSLCAGKSQNNYCYLSTVIKC